MKLVYTDKALSSLSDVIEFNKNNYSEEEQDKYLDELLNRVDQLELHPYMGSYEPYLPETGVRRIIYKHVKTIYRVENSLIYILLFFDSRKDPLEMLSKIKK